MPPQTYTRLPRDFPRSIPAWMLASGCLRVPGAPAVPPGVTKTPKLSMNSPGPGVPFTTGAFGIPPSLGPRPASALPGSGAVSGSASELKPAQAPVEEETRTRPVKSRVEVVMPRVRLAASAMEAFVDYGKRSEHDAERAGDPVPGVTWTGSWNTCFCTLAGGADCVRRTTFVSGALRSKAPIGEPPR